ncbi:MAG TPA: TetR/AcrR family transcriptional regulator [Candidatus Binataceae bacterium]|nr:TetR/AcrR family transcriptional regulator [Candidatus Binataceae bacterium]
MRAKRPQFTSRGEIERRRSLDAGASVLARRGYAGTQLSESAQEAEIQPGSLYYHFESREKLIEEVLRRGANLSFGRVRAVVDALLVGASALECLTAALRAHVKFRLVESDYARAVVRSIGQYPEDLWSRANSIFRSHREKFFDQLIGGAIKADQLDPVVDRSALGRLISGAANWAPDWYRLEGSSSVAQIGDLLARRLLRGVGTRGRLETSAKKFSVRAFR